MDTSLFDYYLDLHRADIEVELFEAALAVQQVRGLIINGGHAGMAATLSCG
jgi:hypothetical protein